MWRPGLNLPVLLEQTKESHLFRGASWGKLCFNIANKVPDDLSCAGSNHFVIHVGELLTGLQDEPTHGPNSWLVQALSAPRVQLAEVVPGHGSDVKPVLHQK